MRLDPRSTPCRILPLREREPIIPHSGGNFRVTEALLLVPPALRDTGHGIGFGLGRPIKPFGSWAKIHPYIHVHSADLSGLQRRDPASTPAHVWFIVIHLLIWAKMIGPGCRAALVADTNRHTFHILLNTCRCTKARRL